MKNFKHIANWQEQDLTCENCGSKKSVKYKSEDKTYCNRCILKAI